MLLLDFWCPFYKYRLLRPRYLISKLTLLYEYYYLFPVLIYRYRLLAETHLNNLCVLL
jgi:hypothetical protein